MDHVGDPSIAQIEGLSIPTKLHKTINFREFHDGMEPRKTKRARSSLYPSLFRSRISLGARLSGASWIMFLCLVTIFCPLYNTHQILDGASIHWATGAGRYAKARETRSEDFRAVLDSFV